MVQPLQAKIGIKVTGLARYSSGLEEMTKKLEALMLQNISELTTEIREFTEKILKESPSYHALTSTHLRGAFGFQEGEEKKKLNDIIEAFVEDIDIDFVKIRKYKGFEAKFELYFNKDNFHKIINLQEAKIITESGEELDWLKWLLLEGDKTIIEDYYVYFKPDSGRSNIAVMVEGDGSSWRVPSSVSGTSRNNFITREIKKNESVYAGMISTYVQDIFNNARK